MVNSIVFLGECMVEHRADGDVFFGGDTFNTAYYSQHLLAQNCDLNPSIYYATAIGKDPQSEQFKALMAQSQIVSDFCIIHDTKTLGQYWVNLDEKGERTFRFDRSNSAAKDYFSLSHKLIDVLNTCAIDAIYLSGISLAILSSADRKLLISALEQFKMQGGFIYFDNNYRPTLWQQSSPIHDYFALMVLANVAFLTDEDEYAVYGTQSVSDIIDLHYKGAGFNQTLVIRQGAAPCVIKAPDQGSLFCVSALQLAPEEIIDTCAAGDAFAAGFLVANLAGYDFHAATAYAHKVAAAVIKQHGALISSHFLPKLSNQECAGVDTFY